MANRAFIIGGTGQIGRAIAAEFLDRGWEVVLGARGGRARPDDLLARGATLAVVDRELPGALTTALAGGADAVIDTVAFDDHHAAQLLALDADVGAFVVVSSASVYRDVSGRSLDEAGTKGFPDLPVPISETQPTIAPGPQSYSTRKAALERTMLDRSTRPVTILRPCAIHGLHSCHPREWWFVKRMLDQRPVIPLAYGGRSRFHTTAVANIGALVATVLAHSEKESRILNIADPDVLTALDIGSLIAERMDYRGKILPLGPGGRTEGLGLSPWSIPGPLVLDTQAALALGYTPRTTYRDAVGPLCDGLRRQETIAWEAAFPELAAYPWPLFDYESEDAAGLRAA